MILSKIKTQNRVESIKNSDKIISREIISKEINNENDFKIDTITEISNNKEQPKEIIKHLNQTVMPSHSDEEINKLKK